MSLAGIITLGIGPGATTEHFILSGLEIGDAAAVAVQNRRYGVSMRGRLGTSRVSEVNVRTGEKTVSEY